MIDNLVKVELGCGTTKNAGYIGIDRYLLPNVDIVADLDKGIPLEDDYVDVLFCSHSLEHFDNLVFIIDEIYRVCKHKAIVNILAPYHTESVNQANFYHKQVFNESTFRFFTKDAGTTIDIKDYYNPHAFTWGLSSSDNSIHTTNLCTLNVEYFYFPGYDKLSQDVKRNARKSLLNVCDQIYYSLAVNKSGINFTEEIINELKEKAIYHEVPLINTIRNRQLDNAFNSSIVYDIKRWDEEVLSKQEVVKEELVDEINRTNIIIDKLESSIDDKIILCDTKITEKFSTAFLELQKKLMQNEMEFNDKIAKVYSSYKDNITALRNNQILIQNLQNQMEQNKIDNANSISELAEKIHDNLEVINCNNATTIQSLQEKINNINREKDSLAVLALDLIKAKEKNSFFQKNFSLFKNKHDMYNAIRSIHQDFVDGLILQKQLRMFSILKISNTIPYEGYFEYKITGCGNRINFFLFSNIGAKVFIEIVLAGKIVKQELITIQCEGKHSISLEEYIKGEVYIRFKTLDNMSIVRILEIVGRKYALFENRHLAAFIE